MARSFNGSSDAITIALNLSAFSKITIAFWLNWTTFANNDKLVMEHSTNYASNAGGFIINPNSGNPSGVFYSAVASGSGGHLELASFTRPSAGVWHSYVFHIDANAVGSAALPKTYVDGVSQTLSNTGSVTYPGGVTFGNYNLYIMSRAASSLFGAGAMAEFAIWGGVFLDDAEAVALSKGYRPAMIRPGSLVLYQPMLRANADLKTGVAPTLTGTTVSEHPRIIMPRRSKVKRMRPTVAAAPTFQAAWARSSNLPVLGTGTF